MIETLQDFETQKELLKKIRLTKKESTILSKLSSQELQQLLSYLKHKNILSDDKRMKLSTYNKTKVLNRDWHLTNSDKVEPVVNFDVKIVNDTLSLIRKGKEGYVYYIRYIELLLKYEPDMAVDYIDGIFYCGLKKKSIC